MHLRRLIVRMVKKVIFELKTKEEFYSSKCITSSFNAPISVINWILLPNFRSIDYLQNVYLIFQCLFNETYYELNIDKTQYNGVFYVKIRESDLVKRAKKIIVILSNFC